MDIKERVKGIDTLVLQGAIVDAVKIYFADDVDTSDYGNMKTNNKAQMVDKMTGFTESIASVNTIKRHYSLVDGNVSASEFTFDFDMKDGSKIKWHEIIRRVWNEEGKVVSEEYFNAG